MQRLILIFVFVLTTVILYAQPGDPGFDPGDGGTGGAVPVDGGLSFLLAAGIGYGAKTGYDYRKKKKG